MTEDHLPEENNHPAESLQPTPPPQQIRIRHPQRLPVITYTIMALTILVYMLQLGTEILFGYDLIARFGLKINEAIVAGQFWRLITPILLHGSFLHIGFNMYALYVLGLPLERYFGHWQFLLLYLVSGFAGVVASFAFTESPSLGASTAVFGLLAAQGVFAYQNQNVFGRQAREALRSIVNIAVINFIIGMSPGIDNWGHFGGLIGGLMMTWIGGPVMKLEGISPNFQLVNSRLESRTLLATALTFFVFGLVTLAVIANYLP